MKIGDVPVGGNNPIRVQSMTTVDTMDTKGSVEQSIRMIESGCEYVRLTAPSVKEARNLEVIRKELRARGYHTPLVADIHFTPNAAELAAGIPLIDLLVRADLTSSKGEARRLIGQGGVYVNNERVGETDAKVDDRHRGTQSFVFLRSGKKKYRLVRVV